MDDNKQQIIHYFIEEAQEHLETVEQGLLDLAEVIADAERVNEMFRAAHSIKGGAAMLGFEGIQSIAHHLEDCFKILRDQPVPVDQKLESLFLKGYDALKELVEELATSPTLSLRPEIVESVLTGSAANFVALKEYLEEMLNTNTHDTMSREAPLTAATIGGGTAVMAPPVATPPVNVVAIVTAALQQMLVLFKQGDTPASRQQLVAIAGSLATLKPEATNWQALVTATGTAIGNQHNTFNAVAPLVIRELKQAGDLLAANHGQDIVVSAALQQATTATAPVAPAATVAATQITIPVDARGAAQAILQSFNRQQVTELVVLLHRVISNSKQN
jgi:chemotaxis protein histidine kinase CheA